ncbi:MAG: AEC family transporter, partial [Oscillospiraceae bacterium]|nr:AEC family transporter [Oscillospiraceae bacterium]
MESSSLSPAETKPAVPQISGKRNMISFSALLFFMAFLRHISAYLKSRISTSTPSTLKAVIKATPSAIRRWSSSAALLGIAFIQNIYGTSGLAPLMIIGSVPLYNIMAVTVLELFKPGSKGISKKTVLETLKGIATNPILIGILTGIIWSLLRIPLGGILQKTVTSVGNVATPLGLMAMGATFDFRKAFGKIGPALAATFMKLIGFAAIFLPLAVKLGYRDEQLVATLVMLGSATTVSCFV